MRVKFITYVNFMLCINLVASMGMIVYTNYNVHQELKQLYERSNVSREKALKLHEYSNDVYLSMFSSTQQKVNKAEKEIVALKQELADLKKQHQTNN